MAMAKLDIMATSSRSREEAWRGEEKSGCWKAFDFVEVPVIGSSASFCVTKSRGPSDKKVVSSFTITYYKYAIAIISFIRYLFLLLKLYNVLFGDRNTSPK